MLQKSWTFIKTVKKCSIDSTLQIELNYMYKSHVSGVICRYHLRHSKWFAFTNGQTTNREGYGTGFNANSRKIKYRFRLIIRLKANKYY